MAFPWDGEDTWRAMAGPGGAVPIAALMDAEAALEAASAKCEALSRTVPGGARLRDRIEADVVEAARRLRGTDDRRRILRDVVSRWKAELNRPPELRRTAGLAERLAGAYASLLLEDFRAEFDAEFAAENPAEEIRWKEAERAAKEVERLTREVEKARRAADNGVVSQAFRFEVPDPRGLLRKFVTVWRERARRFAVPVTIHGTAIESLEEPHATDWQRAWGKCGCRNGTGDGLLPPARHVARSHDRPAPEAVPAIFTGNRK